MVSLSWHILNEVPWYLMAARKGLKFISVAILENTFMSGSNGIFLIDFHDIHALHKLDKMDIRNL